MRAYSSQSLSTASVAPEEAAELWIDLICETFVQLTARQTEATDFKGQISREALGELEFSTVTASGQDVFRTKRFVRSATDEYLLFSIQRRGKGYVVQDGRTADLAPGSMALYDSGRPYSLHFPEAFQQLVVQIPKTAIGADDTRRITAVSHTAGTPGAVIAQLLVAMSEQLGHGGAALDPLGDHVLSALEKLATEPTDDSGQLMPQAYLRNLALGQMRRDLADPHWTVTGLAERCHISVRTLYRLFPGEGVASVMRRMRTDEAKRFLRRTSRPPLAAIAHHCGFASESGFIRAFRTATGMTPMEFADQT